MFIAWGPCAQEEPLRKPVEQKGEGIFSAPKTSNTRIWNSCAFSQFSLWLRELCCLHARTVPKCAGTLGACFSCRRWALHLFFRNPIDRQSKQQQIKEKWVRLKTPTVENMQMESRRRRRQLIVFLLALLIMPSLALHEANGIDWTAVVCSPQEPSTAWEHIWRTWRTNTHMCTKTKSTKELMNIRVEERFEWCHKILSQQQPRVDALHADMVFFFFFFFVFFLIIMLLPFGLQLQALIEGTCNWVTKEIESPHAPAAWLTSLVLSLSLLMWNDGRGALRVPVGISKVLRWQNANWACDGQDGWLPVHRGVRLRQRV